jgi:hypothetical protein
MEQKANANSSAASAAAAKPNVRKNRGVLGIVTALFFAMAAVSMLPTTLVIVVGMMPTAVAYFVDTSPQRSLGPTVLFLNFSGVLPTLFRLWKSGHTVDRALDIILQPTMLLLMYLPAAFGWLLYAYVPVLVSGILRRKAEMRIRSLEKDQDYLVEQWGSAVAQASANETK